MSRPVDPLEPRDLIYFDEASDIPRPATPAEEFNAQFEQMKHDLSRFADNQLTMVQAIGHLRERIAQLEARGRGRKPGIHLAPPPLVGLNS